MLTEKIIRAADYLPKQEESEDASLEAPQMTQTDKLLFALFGDTPDYNKPEFEKLWQEIFDAEEEDTIAYCMEKGVDITGEDGEPVTGWRDIAVMIKAIDLGLLELAKKKE